MGTAPMVLCKDELMLLQGLPRWDSEKCDHSISQSIVLCLHAVHECRDRGVELGRVSQPA